MGVPNILRRKRFCIPVIVLLGSLAMGDDLVTAIERFRDAMIGL